MWCVKCELHFTWRQAEKLLAIKQDDAVVKKVRLPFRFIGAWIWAQRAKWGLMMESKRRRRRHVVCGSAVRGDYSSVDDVVGWIEGADELEDDWDGQDGLEE